MNLKPQDIVVALKLCVIGERVWTYGKLADDIVLSASEINAAVKRLLVSNLLRGPVGDEAQPRPNRDAIREFLRHGLRFVFPVVPGAIVRGMPTSYAAAPLVQEIHQGDDPIPVWPWAHGQARGAAFKPLYRTVPEAASKDAALYRALVVADGLRDNSIRVRELSGRHLERSLAANE
jgi:hypothetical protein